MATTFDAWLRALAAAGKGRLPPLGINIDRGLPFEETLVFGGEWAGAALSASLRVEPDAPGSTIADFTVSAPVVYGGYTGFTLTLTKEQTAALPESGAADALAQLAFDVLFTPSGGTQRRAFGGVATVSGKVTNAS